MSKKRQNKTRSNRKQQVQMYLQTYIPKFVQNFSNNSAIRKAQRAPYHRIRCQGSEGDLPSMDHPLKASNSGLGSSILT